MLDPKHDLVLSAGEFEVRWVRGSLLVSVGGDAVLVDAPPGTTKRLSELKLLQRIRSVAFSSGRLESIGDFLPLLWSVERFQSVDFPFEVRGPMGDERLGLLIEAWSRGWVERFPIGLDMIQPGYAINIGPLKIKTVGLEMGEPKWTKPCSILPCVGMGWRIEWNEHSVVWVKSCTPTPAVARLCRDASLAILEVGVQRWPASDRRWRLSVGDAGQYGALAKEVWLVGDDGGPLNVDVVS